MNFKRLKQSFTDAWQGVVYVYKYEQNFKIQIFTGIVVVAMALTLGLRRSEMVVIFLLVLLVLILELLNSALEKFLDILKPRMHLQVALVKDIMAAMVFIASIGATFIGVMIFYPYLALFFEIL